MWVNIILVGIGSMLGGISRYLFSDLIKRLLPVTFPAGTFLANMTGCFLIGIISGWIVSRVTPSESHRLFFAVGFCGSFTTFSTFSLENMNLLASKAYLLLSLNIGLSVTLGLILTGLGYLISTK